MLGTKVNKDYFKLIGQKVIIEDENGPLEVEILDIVQGQVIYTHYSGTTASLPLEEFEKQCTSI